MTEFFVSVAGDDSADGTSGQPFKTLERARIAVRDATGDVTVHLRRGVHTLTAPLRLAVEDSGRDGRITYQAYGYGTDDCESVQISGGRQITDWRVKDGVWLAEVGDLDTRQLYVNGQRAERAGIDAIPGDAERTPTGYRTNDLSPLVWRAPAGVEFVYRGIYPWTEARCGVESVSAHDGSAVITMAQPNFAKAVELYNFAWDGHAMTGPGLPTRVENDPAFLTEPGGFVLDRTRPGRHVLHYLPRPGEDPAVTRVVAPSLETLLSIDGTRGIAFKGLTFADATWLKPNGDNGFLHYHGSGYFTGGGVDKVTIAEGSWVTVPRQSQTIPACVSLNDSTEIRFEECRFTRLGATALGMAGGADLTVRGCDFDLVAASAISVSGSRDTTIVDNLIQHVGLDYSGSPGVAITDTVNCTVAANHVREVPHCGIVAGPGKGTRILRNLTTGTMNVMADGGGIYLSSVQGDSHGNGAVVSGNVINDTRTPYNFGLYTDYGAAWVTVVDNVVFGADNTAVLTVNPPLENVVYRGNFWDAEPMGANDIPATVTYQDNTTITDGVEFAEATAAIRARAGLERNRTI